MIESWEDYIIPSSPPKSNQRLALAFLKDYPSILAITSLKTTQGNIKQNTAKPAHVKGKDCSTKWPYLPKYILQLLKQLFHPWPSRWKPLLKQVHTALQMLEWHLDWACVISLPACLGFPRGLPGSSTAVLGLQASPPRASNNIYQLQFSPSSNISSGPCDSDPTPP